MPNRADTFNRSDNALTLGTPSDGGSAWSTTSGVMGIVSNTAYSPSSAGQAVLECGEADGEVSITVPTISSQTLIFRQSDASNFWQLIALGSNLVLYKTVDSENNLVSSVSGQTISNGAILKVTLNSSTINCYLNGVLKFSATDAFNVTATKHGFRSSSGTTRFDNFSFVGTEPPAPTYSGRALLMGAG